MKHKRPIIGITLDWEKEGTFSQYPYYGLRTHYFDAVYAVGGLPIAIPYLHHAIDEYLDYVDGVIIPGGGFAFPAEWYVDKDEKPPYEVTPRLAFDLELAEKTFAKNKPILGICAGMQLMGGMNGCKMTRNVGKYLGTSFEHWDTKPDRYAHEVHVNHQTMLEKITGKKNFEVNTRHREALVEIPDNVTVNCTSPDGVVEGIELPHYKFALGVQWHPEFFFDKENPNLTIFKALVDACK